MQKYKQKRSNDRGDNNNKTKNIKIYRNNNGNNAYIDIR